MAGGITRRMDGFSRALGADVPAGDPGMVNDDKIMRQIILRETSLFPVFFEGFTDVN